MISQRAAAIRGLRIAHWFRLTENDGFLCWLPLFHCGGDEPLYATMTTGGVFATLRKAVVETMFSMIERHRLSWTFLLPGIITEFLNHPRRRDHDLSSLRFAGGYANMMPDIITQLTAACGSTSMTLLARLRRPCSSRTASPVRARRQVYGNSQRPCSISASSMTP